jgi:preprotein translocase subunit SecE
MEETQERARSSSPNIIVRKLQAVQQFYRDVKLEMKRVTWPTRQDVYGTTIVTIIVVFFFGFYLWGANWTLSYVVRELIGFLSR